MTKVNLQQIPKVRSVLECFVPPAGWGLVDSDLQAVEPRVIAYFSRDPQYIELFASGRVHDVYLYVAMALWPAERDAIAAVYYLPGGGTSVESVDAAKAKFKHLRAVAKELHLSAVYGASAGRIYSSLRVKGFQVTLAEVQAMRKRYWALFAGVQDWFGQLKSEREDRGGWIYNGRGRPLCVPDDKVKDIGNIFCLAGDSLVRVRGQGYKRLDTCTEKDYVWDGVEWVSTDGLIFRGHKPTINMQGIHMTPDHRVMTKYGWRRADRVQEVYAVAEPGVSWGDLWGLCRSIGCEVAQAGAHLCRRSLSARPGKSVAEQSEARQSAGL